MERLTERKKTGYSTQDLQAALDRLGRWEDLYEQLDQEREAATARMQLLTAQGREKSATYRQLFSNKLTLSILISRLDASR